MLIKSGNDANLRILCKDVDDNAITNLADANEIICQIKSQSMIEKKKSLGEILVDDPSTGYLGIKIDASDTVNLTGTYLIGVEIRWTENVQEIDLEDEYGTKFKRIEIKHNVVIQD